MYSFEKETNHEKKSCSEAKKMKYWCFLVTVDIFKDNVINLEITRKKEKKINRRQLVKICIPF